MKKVEPSGIFDGDVAAEEMLSHDFNDLLLVFKNTVSQRASKTIVLSCFTLTLHFNVLERGRLIQRGTKEN